jgi:hypothetical protein
MSLCSRYCDCGTCIHGRKLCTYCSECKKEHDIKESQEQHNSSVLKQKSKVKRIIHEK